MVLKVFRSKKFSRRVLYGILVIIIPAFVFWGAGSISDRPGPVGRIFGQNISLEDLVDSREAVKVQVVLNYFHDYDELGRMLRDNELVNSMAWERLVLLQAAKKERIRVPNSDVMAFIARHPLFQRGGAFDRNSYESFLGSPLLSMTPRQFEELVRQNLQISKYRSSIIDGLVVTEEEVMEAFSDMNDKVSVSYFLFDKTSFAGDVSVPEEDVLAAYNANRSRFVSSEKADIEYIELTYSDAGEREKIDRTVDKIYADIYASPDTMREIARREGLRYGRTGLFSRNEVLPGMAFFPELHETVFTLGPGEISPPLFSDPQKGTAYVFRKLSSEKPSQLSFEEIKDELSATLNDLKSIEKAKVEADRAYEEIVGGTSFNQAAAARNLPVKTAKSIGWDDYLEGLGSARGIVANAGNTGVGNVMSPLLSPRGALIVRIDDIEKADRSALSRQQKEALRSDLLRRKHFNAMQRWFSERASDIELFVDLG